MGVCGASDFLFRFQSEELKKVPNQNTESVQKRRKKSLNENEFSLLSCSFRECVTYNNARVNVIYLFKYAFPSDFKSH